VTVLMTADLHLTSEPLDRYRFDVFPFLHKLMDKHAPETLLILGDLTDKKDRHDAKLVNEIVSELELLADRCEVVVLKGNHDYVDEWSPFFDFVNSIKNVEYITKAQPIAIPNYDVLALPHTRHWRSQWQAVLSSEYDFAITHQAIKGCKVQNGADVGEVPLEIYEHLECPVFAGDIHIPQRLGPVRYCGAPHPVTFGDTFAPRVLLYDGHTVQSIPNKDAIRKVQATVSSVADIAELGCGASDQVKLKVKLKPEEVGAWDDVRTACLDAMRDKGAVVRGIELIHPKRRRRLSSAKSSVAADPLEVFDKFCDKADIDETESELGASILKAVSDA